MTRNRSRNRKQSGQVLLITIMLLATALTVILSTSFTSTTNTITTKLEEESQKALAAAEAGIEKAVRQGNIADLRTLPGLSSLDSGSATVTETADKTTFLSPVLQKDESYTFYLTNYPAMTSSIASGKLQLYYGSQGVSCSNVALEITLIYGSSPNYNIQRWVADAGGKLGAGVGIYLGEGGTKEDNLFNCKTDNSSIDLTGKNAKILIVKSLFSPTKLVLEGITFNLPAQGKTVISEAKTTTGVSKKVQLFQSYPQIPSDFFVTSL